jgi:hypothetical protein
MNTPTVRSVGLFMALDDLHAARVAVAPNADVAAILARRQVGRLATPASAQYGPV